MSLGEEACLSEWIFQADFIVPPTNDVKVLLLGHPLWYVINILS